MTQIISITEFRKNLFKIADMVAYKGIEVEIEKEGRRIVKMVKLDEAKEEAKKALKFFAKPTKSYRIRLTKSADRLVREERD